jgi:hypothetical protein
VLGHQLDRDLDELVAPCRNGTVKVYPKASPAINGEHPEEVATDIAAFLGAG